SQLIFVGWERLRASDLPVKPVPGILNDIEIRRVGRLSQHFIATVFKEVLHNRGTVNWGIVLLEVGKGEHMVLERGFICLFKSL
ncbi:hypothetical protein CALCODRAFT_538266, partial [Calocera cornea HHB12733]